jgi:hypothetical protein
VEPPKETGVGEKIVPGAPRFWVVPLVPRFV